MVRSILEIVDEAEILVDSISDYLDKGTDGATLDFKDPSLIKEMDRYGIVITELSIAVRDTENIEDYEEELARMTNVRYKFKNTINNVKAYFGV